MARTVAEIKKTMTDAFMADATIREKYGLNESSTWNGSFSSVSLENIIFFIVSIICMEYFIYCSRNIVSVCSRYYHTIAISPINCNFTNCAYIQSYYFIFV